MYADGDIFMCHAFMPMAHMYVGSLMADALVVEWEAVLKVSTEIVRSIELECTLADLCDKVAKYNLPGLGDPRGYWNVHLVRCFVPEVVGIKLPGKLVVDKRSMNRLMHMGGGPKTMSLLGVTDDNIDVTLPKMCSVVEKLARSVGRTNHCVSPAQMTITACESHRRGALVESPLGFGRRPGL